MIKAQNSITGKTNATIIKEFPPLENIEVTPSKETQNLKSEDFYGYNEITVVGEPNLEPNNITSDKSIYGVQGTFDCDCKIDFFNNKLAGSSYTLAQGVKKIDLTHTDLTGITSLANKFLGYSALQEAVIDMKGITNASSLFEDCKNLKILKLTNTQDLETVSRMFDDNKAITETFEFDTSNVKNFYRMYQNCTNLVTIKKMDCSSAISGFDQFFYTNYTNIRNIEGFVNYGKAFTEKTENYSAYTMNLNPASGLTREAIVNVFENLYDLNLTYDVANGGTLYSQQINLGYTLGAKITAEDRKIATDKGWNIYG